MAHDGWMEPGQAIEHVLQPMYNTQATRTVLATRDAQFLRPGPMRLRRLGSVSLRARFVILVWWSCKGIAAAIVAFGVA